MASSTSMALLLLVVVLVADVASTATAEQLDERDVQAAASLVAELELRLAARASNSADRAELEGVELAFDDINYGGQTTRTPAFLGLPNSMGQSPDNWPGNGGRGVIIGVIDHGIDDTHPSLDDAGFQGMPPPSWKGSCHSAMRCNKKLIGAKNIYDHYAPYDTDSGHGTHVATTAAGTFVTNVSINNLAGGNAYGVAPYAHLSIYEH